MNIFRFTTPSFSVFFKENMSFFVEAGQCNTALFCIKEDWHDVSELTHTHTHTESGSYRTTMTARIAGGVCFSIPKAFI